MTLSSSHSGLIAKEPERLDVVSYCSCRGKRDVNETSLLKKYFSESKRASSIFSKVMDVLQEL